MIRPHKSLRLFRKLERNVTSFYDKFFTPFSIISLILLLLSFNNTYSSFVSIPYYAFHLVISLTILILLFILFGHFVIKTVSYKSYLFAFLSCFLLAFSYWLCEILIHY